MNSSEGTDYMLPYGMSPIRTLHSGSRRLLHHQADPKLSPQGQAMTVKDFLTPLASKLSPHKLSPQKTRQSGTAGADPYSISGVVPLDPRPTAQAPPHLDEDQDSTLVDGDGARADAKGPTDTETTSSIPKSSSYQTSDPEGTGKTSSNPHSLTSSAFVNTELDTSLSTIPDFGSIGTVTTTSSFQSVSSVEDQAFQDGLANLDANIARIQKQLRQSITQH